MNSSLVSDCHDVEVPGSDTARDGDFGEDDIATPQDNFPASPSSAPSVPSNSSDQDNAGNSTSGSASSRRRHLQVSWMFGWVAVGLTPVSTSLVISLIGHLLLSINVPTPGYLTLQHQHHILLFLALCLPLLAATWPKLPLGIAFQSFSVQQKSGR